MFLRILQAVSIETDEIIDEQRQGQDFFAPRPMPISRNKKWKGMHQVWSYTHEDRSFVDRLTQTANISVLQVSEPAVDNPQCIG
jgi:hypothetical protein